MISQKLGIIHDSSQKKFHTDDVSLPRSGYLLLVEANFSRDTTNQKHYSDLGSNTSSVWNFLQSLLTRHFAGKSMVTSGGVMKYRFYSQANLVPRALFPGFGGEKSALGTRLFSSYYFRLVNEVPQSEGKRPRKRMSGDC